MNDQDFHVQFTNQERTFDVDFYEQTKSISNTVVINGRHYTMQGKTSDIEWLVAKIPEFSKKSDISMVDLIKSLQNVGSKNIQHSSIERVHEVGIQSLQFKKPLGQWMTDDQISAQKTQTRIADKYWKLYIILGEKKDHSKLLEFLKTTSDSPKKIENEFSKALLHKASDEGLAHFRKIFRHLSYEQLKIIDSCENLSVIQEVPLSQNPVQITKQDRYEMKNYMRDSDLSGILLISDKTGEPHAIASSDHYDPQTPFAMHSIGKVFTGLLALRLIEEGIISEEELKQPIQLDKSVIDQLSKEVANQLKKTSLLEVMLHQGRYGDYLRDYQKAIKKALKDHLPLPQINQPEDFLKFADTKLVDLDQLDPSGGAYSNLGLLLVGLSLKASTQFKNGKTDGLPIHLEKIRFRSCKH